MKGDRGMANLQVRDTVFCRFIGTESNLLEVFNAIRKTGYTDASKVMITTLAGSFYSNIKNDISFIMELDNNNHSVFLLYYHLVLVVKYRRKVFSDQMSQYAKDIFVRICSSYNITLEEWNHDQDYVHVMFRAHPNTEMSKFINAYKSASSRLIKKDFPEVRRKLWKEMLWSRSYCLLTTGGAPIETIRKYIENQGR